MIRIEPHYKMFEQACLVYLLKRIQFKDIIKVENVAASEKFKLLRQAG